MKKCFKEVLMHSQDGTGSTSLILNHFCSFYGMHVCVGKKSLFFGKFGVLFFLVTSVLRFALLSYCRRYMKKSWKQCKYTVVTAIALDNTEYLLFRENYHGELLVIIQFFFAVKVLYE